MSEPRKRPWPLLLLAALPVGVLVFYAMPKRAPEASVLIGTWQREDAEYRLVVKAVDPGGRATVEYLNPKPIHVGEARVVAENGILKLGVLLQDENYPGSTYSLAFDPEIGRLVGEYFQAVQKSTFPVSFRRVP